MSAASDRGWADWKARVEAMNKLGAFVASELESRPPSPRSPHRSKAGPRFGDRAGLVRFHANKRRAAKLQRTPPWVDWDAVARLYDQAQRLSEQTGIPHHVDHIIPLQGKRVSGLHVQGNLQILTATENSKKRNHYEVDA